MYRIPDALRDIVFSNPVLATGLKEKLLNLSQVARLITPLVAARTKKEVQPSAVVMGLSRLQRDIERQSHANQASVRYQIRNLSVHSNLHILTFPKSREIHRALQGIYIKVLDRGGFITITEGTSEVTLIVDAPQHDLIGKLINTKPVLHLTDIASVGVRFDQSYLPVPGLLHHILQQLYFQNINVCEIASTATELIVYVAERDVRLAFDSLYQRFVVQPLEF